MAGPDDLAASVLHRQNEIDGVLHDWPHRLEKAPIAGTQPVMPDAGSDVAADVRVDLGVLDSVGEVVVVPPPVAVLGVCEPLVRQFGFGGEASDVEGHRCFCVIPRVGVTALEPQDHAAGLLHRRDGVTGGCHVDCRKNAGRTYASADVIGVRLHGPAR